MILFKNIRFKIGRLILKKLKKKTVRKRKIFNFENSNLVGIIFKAEDNKQIEKIRNFMHFLTERDNTICAIGYVDSNKMPDYLLLKKGYNFFCRKDLNMYFLPKSKLVSDFLLKPFDILIDLDFDNTLPIEYIISLSKAKFKIGPSKVSNPIYDFTFEVKKHLGVDYLIENIKHYTEVFCKTTQYNKITL